MQEDIHEVQFMSLVVQWIALALSQNGVLPFSHADMEAKTKGSRERHDLILYNKSGAPALTGEVKMPWTAEGQSPLNDAVVSGARRKAIRAGVPFFFTWNVNELLLWRTDQPEDDPHLTYYQRYQITEVSKPGHLEFHDVEFAIRGFLRKFLYEYAAYYQGKQKLAAKPLDVRFIETVESNLKQPVLLIRDQFVAMQKDKAAKKRLNDWMRSELGWTVTDDPEALGEQLTRAAKYACYVFVNKLVFHEALHKTIKAMPSLKFPASLTTGEELQGHFAKTFADAKVASGNYETVFGEDISYGDTVPFRADLAVPHWRALIDQLDKFNFAKLDHDVISSLFEKLISPEERSKFGQFFTRVEVVDLINSFCMPQGDETVLDPACGGGTFLVRAYARMKVLQPGSTHIDRLQRIYGVDIERFPVHLSTINLTVREMVEADNYPRVVRDDFLNLRLGGSFGQFPEHRGAGRQRKLEHVNLPVPQFDAVIANPPYIRQEELGKDTKERYQRRMKEVGLTLSGRADIHVYFWPQAASFLKQDGFLGFITSSQWLDVDYGFKFQEWLLKNFRIVALIESENEPWFEGARVATTVAILQREESPAAREANTVRFIQVRLPLREAMGHGGTAFDALDAVNTFRDELLGLTENTVNERYRARMINQGDLRRQGELAGKYAGGKWGMYLRAPDLWFDLLDEYGDKFTPLRNLAEVRFGVKSGKDDFFFPIDCTDDKLVELATEGAREFEARFGVPRKLVESGDVRLVRCGEGRTEVRAIEAKYLEPEVHSLMEISGYVVKEKECKRKILLLPTTERKKLDKYVRRYVEWGEELGWHSSPTCSGRVTSTREWYDLTGFEPGPIVWSKSHQYKHSAPLNQKKLQTNCNLYDVFPVEDLEALVLAGVLNSTLSLLAKTYYGRPVGVEGNLKTEVIDVKMMLVPDPRTAKAEHRERVVRAFNKLSERPAKQFLTERRMRRMALEGKFDRPSEMDRELNKFSDQCELDMPDRRELDDAVLEMIGIVDRARRKQLIDALYDHLRHFFERTRQKEEQAIKNKNLTRRAGQERPEDIAKQIWAEIEEDHPWVDRRYQVEFLEGINDVMTLQVPKAAEPQKPYEVLGGWRVDFNKGKRRVGMLELKTKPQAELLALIAAHGMDGAQWIPFDSEVAATVLESYGNHIAARNKLFQKLVEDRTDDEERQAKILAVLNGIVRGK